MYRHLHLTPLFPSHPLLFARRLVPGRSHRQSIRAVAKQGRTPGTRPGMTPHNDTRGITTPEPHQPSTVRSLHSTPICAGKTGCPTAEHSNGNWCQTFPPIKLHRALHHTLTGLPTISALRSSKHGCFCDLFFPAIIGHLLPNARRRPQTN